MSIAIQDIQYFLAVAEAGRLSGAAEELGVTQPALSKAMQRVEAQFGLQLFERRARGVVLTSAGIRVAEQMRKLQADYADIVLLADEMRAQQAGLLRVGVTDTTGRNRMIAAMASLLKQRPGLRVRIRVDRSDALAAQVREGTLDLALVPAYDGQALGSERTKIDNDPLLPLVRAGHPLARRSRLSLKDVAPFGWMIGPEHSAAYRALQAVFSHHGLAAPTIVVEVPFSSEMNLAMLAATDLLTLVPRSLLQNTASARFAELPVAALRIPRAVVLLSREGSPWSPLMRTLRDQLLARQKT
ncbi:MAG: LysR family transcriptional regulator [Hydrogenophaga sp.]|uniref:LysR family transcriptional regulator n=1 Tax=Hydrogenophaga sp. TaxID=1904254 RepID=UPI0016B82986|nr:LysR family transcriptional regulator [Hydrogenophaga sp.]NIM42457.1 LysR family transcriptional regulator [Hydrogenophaga sp.]NIN27608.1 LysR family transcriptional regulator [Hydrogenophaga sp.]NIN32428.1 LysR family transcriptional regulator [Hydrogenophaga sp.]NIN56879.1 LysR family transcriptional regulator [Hydrogenophaga sp.]NIO53024.1 LysR family transcriptional regulator [Hydrogenophaga sp.]